MVSVIQTQLYDVLKKIIRFDELPPKGNANIILLTYDFRPAPEKSINGAQTLVLDKVIGTSHNSLMMAALYHTPPTKQAFCERILDRL